MRRKIKHVTYHLLACFYQYKQDRAKKSRVADPYFDTIMMFGNLVMGLFFIIFACLVRADWYFMENRLLVALITVPILFTIYACLRHFIPERKIKVIRVNEEQWRKGNKLYVGLVFLIYGIVAICVVISGFIHKD